MSWVERNPHPGPDKPPHPGPEPVRTEALQEWWIAVGRWNAYVQAVRRYEIAIAVDQLARLDRQQPLLPHETIALNIGAMVLDQTVAEKPAVPYVLWR